VTKLLRTLVLPSEISSFEAGYLRRINRIGLFFFLAHVPVMAALGFLNGTGGLLALGLATAVVLGPLLAYATLSNPRSVSMTYGVAAMFMGGVLVHVGQGPMQIEMHFYFFALLAMLAVFGNPMVIVAAAVTVALHHLALWWLVPRSVFNYDAPVWVVAVHAVFVVLESVAATFIARSFFDNVIGLERIVQRRTAELDARNRDMRLVLDQVGQGLLTIDRRGVPSVERSREFDRWFPSSAAGGEGTLFDLFEVASIGFAARSRIAWEQVLDGLMPLSLTLEQMPSRLVAGDRQLSVTYVAIEAREAPERFLVVVTDVTAEAKRALAESERRETLEIFERLLSDRSAVEGFFEEGTALADAVFAGKIPDLPTVRRALHTLKGNSALFGLSGLSTVCHDLETWIAEENRLPTEEACAPLRAYWDQLLARVECLMGKRRSVIEVDEQDYDALEQSARRGAAAEALLTKVHALKLEPAERRLHHFAEQARRVALRLEKDIDVKVDATSARVDPQRWRGFWSTFIHVIRNAVDHGVELADERTANGKPALGTIWLRAYVREEEFFVEVADDGRGVDWAKVVAKAQQLGFPASSEAERKSALFRDGVSTAATLTDISGRGVGMGAVKQATEALGGRIEIETAVHRGTTVRMAFPRTAMAPDLRAPSRSPYAAA
jgi:two-component system chemotaxis sensor kinase CheA